MAVFGKHRLSTYVQGYLKLKIHGINRVTLSACRNTVRNYKRVQKYCPQLTLNDLQPYPAGIRAQAVLANGDLVHDFLFAESPRSLHVCNAPSPAATSAIPIGGYICNKVAEKNQLLTKGNTSSKN